MQTVTTFHEESESMTFVTMETICLTKNGKKSTDSTEPTAKHIVKLRKISGVTRGGQPLVHSTDGDQKISPKQCDRREVGANLILLTRASLHDHRRPRREKRGHKGRQPLVHSTNRDQKILLERLDCQELGAQRLAPHSKNAAKPQCEEQGHTKRPTLYLNTRMWSKKSLGCVVAASADSGTLATDSASPAGLSGVTRGGSPLLKQPVCSKAASKRA
jgi:hypothetical protein